MASLVLLSVEISVNLKSRVVELGLEEKTDLVENVGALQVLLVGQPKTPPEVVGLGVEKTDLVVNCPVPKTPPPCVIIRPLFSVALVGRLADLN